MAQHKLISEKSDPAFELLKRDVDQIISSFQKRLVNSVTNVVSRAIQYAKETPQGGPQGTQQQPMQAGQPKSLPWFKYGIRGFLNKLWHGDSPSNPNYQSESMTLESYIRLEEEVDGAADIIIREMLCEVGATDADVQSGWMDVFKDFRDELFTAIQQHLTTPRQWRRATDSPDSPPDSPPDSSSAVAAQEPQPEPEKVVKSPKNPEPTDEEKEESRDWWKRFGQPALDNMENTEIRRIKKLLDTHSRHETTFRRIFVGKRTEAEEIMKKVDLDPNNPEEIKLIWPRHLNVPIRDKETKGAASLHRNESEDHKAAMRILEGAKPSTMANYYKILLESRR